MDERLAIDGGSPLRRDAFPARNLIHATHKAAVIAYLDEVIAGNGMVGYGGERSKAYEEAFATFQRGGFAHAVNSGTNALFCAPGGLHLPHGSEVIVPAITDPGGVMPVALLGLLPVAADTTPDSYNVSAETINIESSAGNVMAGLNCEVDDTVAAIRKVERKAVASSQ